MTYRTRTYIAADWTGDKVAIDKLHEWNDSNYWSLSFTDAHELMQSYDTSLPCSIKKSLKERMDASKTFILIVGDKTNSLTKGGCQLCRSYNSYTKACAREHYVDTRSYIDYECDKAVEANIKIVVLYYGFKVEKSKCPLGVRYRGVHLPMLIWDDDARSIRWNYSAIKDAISN